MSADLIQPVIGFRGWNLKTLGGVCWLDSAGVGNLRWKPGVNQAECVADGRYQSGVEPGAVHEAPGHRCSCGLYAWLDAALLIQAVADTHVMGAVAAWGRIEVHPAGFRSEFAKIVVIGISERDVLMESPMVGLVEKAARHYGADLVPLAEVPKAAREHGIVVPEELRPTLEPSDEVADRWRKAMAQLAGTGMAVGSYRHPVPTQPSHGLFQHMSSRHLGIAVARTVGSPFGSPPAVSTYDPANDTAARNTARRWLLGDLVWGALNATWFLVSHNSLAWINLTVAAMMLGAAIVQYRRWRRHGGGFRGFGCWLMTPGNRRGRHLFFGHGSDVRCQWCKRRRGSSSID